MRRKRKYHRNRAPGTRPPGRPATGKNAMIGIRWPKPLYDGIEKYAQEQMLDRGAALRQLVTRFLVEKGFVKAAEVYASPES